MNNPAQINIHAAKAIIMLPPNNFFFAPLLLLEGVFESEFELESGDDEEEEEEEDEDDDPEEAEAELGGESVEEDVVLESESPASLKIFASGESGGRFNIAAKHTK